MGRLESADLTPSRVERLRVTPTARIVGLREQHLEYLDHHRRDEFVG